MSEEGQEIVQETGEQVVEMVVDNSDPLDDVFPDRHPLAEKGVELSEPPSEEVAVETVEETPAPTAEPVVEKQIQSAESKELAAFKAKALDETRKRQLLEQQLAARPVEKEAFDWDDPDKTLERMESKFDAKFQTKLVEMSTAQCMARHDDFAEKEQVFMQMAMENRAIVEDMLRQPDPAEYAYQLATQKQFTDEVGSDPEMYRSKIEAELRTKIEAEYKSKTDSHNNLVASLPPSAKSLGNKTQVDVAIGDPMDAIFDDHPS